jgi:hypothetical protein
MRRLFGLKRLGLRWNDSSKSKLCSKPPESRPYRSETQSYSSADQVGPEESATLALVVVVTPLPLLLSLLLPCSCRCCCLCSCLCCCGCRCRCLKGRRPATKQPRPKAWVQSHPRRAESPTHPPHTNKNYFLRLSSQMRVSSPHHRSQNQINPISSTNIKAYAPYDFFSKLAYGFYAVRYNRNR